VNAEIGHTQVNDRDHGDVDRPHSVRPYRRMDGSLCYHCGVRGWVALFLNALAATATALLLALIARDSIGMPPDMVREDALSAASIMVAAVAGMSSRRRKL
jgi:hypothetical protein